MAERAANSFVEETASAFSGSQVCSPALHYADDQGESSFKTQQRLPSGTDHFTPIYLFNTSTCASATLRLADANTTTGPNVLQPSTLATDLSCAFVATTRCDPVDMPLHW